MPSHVVPLLLITLFLCPLLILEAAAAATPAPEAATTFDISWWCEKTPHPDTCKYYFWTSPLRYQAPKHQSDFRRMLIELVKDGAEAARDRALALGANVSDGPQRAAWADCVNLFDDTIMQIDRTMVGLSAEPHADSEKCTEFDAQTWLSAALTNIKTCVLGSADLNVTEIISPITTNANLSQLISNTLAVNGFLLKKHNKNITSFWYNEEGDSTTFPSWVSGHEGRMLRSSRIRVHVVVAKDGSGNYRTIQEAINLAGRRRSTSARFVIYVKRGVYRENIWVAASNNNVMLIGDGTRYTIITSARSVKGGYTTFNSATAGIDGSRFIARDLTFRNTAGPWRGQAVALRSGSDLSVFYRCAIEGYQDTLYVHSQRQFFRECYVHGTIDFVFGNAAVVFQNCIFMVRKPIYGQANVITAQGRADPFQNTGITIQNSVIIPAPDLRPVVRHYKTYLGRPWQEYSRVVVMKSYIDRFVYPAGWSPWTPGSSFALNTLYYGEYANFGPGSSTRWRVRWKGFHAIRRASVASRFTVARLIAGNSWLPSTRIPFASGI